jgi:hypothetical protein
MLMMIVPHLVSNYLPNYKDEEVTNASLVLIETPKLLTKKVKTPKSLTLHFDPYWDRLNETLVEDMANMTTTRPLNDNELAGNNILIAIKTTRKYHSKRLPPILDTWLTTANGSNIFIITDGSDPKYQDICQKLGINYVISKNYGNGFKANQCYKTGVELGLMDKHENQHYDWFCNVDDDMYVNMKSLINFLAKFDTSSDVYIGHAANAWPEAHWV